MLDYSNKTVLVTGGASGIGRAATLAFARQGASVQVIELNDSAWPALQEELKDLEGNANLHTCDVSDQQAVVALFNKIGRVDVLINNAGVAHVGKVTNTPEADFERLFRVNVKGVYNCMYAAIPLMQQQGGGVILNMSSIAAYVGLPDRFAYSMTKGAVSAMTISAARDYLADKIRVNSISPARVHTPFVDGFIAKNYPGKEAEMFEKLSHSQPIGRMGKPEEIANLALYLCSDEASFITGTDYPIDGGFIKLNT
ncbi:SDR family NAD(P)-dependent oxidoreductase [Flavihumibacter solisilvae]|jgi:NAD(P)-dependent dehydrogenase (short-subunit alcohol dehydrogenase family)|uniref:Short-chain dehydrogenase n=1 Tax=Flavihumibacter solisilvae TaxID=1349421 RepID=A0A0C1LHV4_9BACT|nr:SDR family oxidoreductase [Flavihumibacter solisilvae]KIC94963.1 short-chain dehydrogenase [Flavihumibacter solisilvae]